MCSMSAPVRGSAPSRGSSRPSTRSKEGCRGSAGCRCRCDRAATDSQASRRGSIRHCLHSRLYGGTAVGGQSGSSQRFLASLIQCSARRRLLEEWSRPPELDPSRVTEETMEDAQEPRSDHEGPRSPSSQPTPSDHGNGAATPSPPGSPRPPAPERPALSGGSGPRSRLLALIRLAGGPRDIPPRPAPTEHGSRLLPRPPRAPPLTTPPGAPAGRLRRRPATRDGDRPVDRHSRVRTPTADRRIPPEGGRTAGREVPEAGPKAIRGVGRREGPETGPRVVRRRLAAGSRGPAAGRPWWRVGHGLDAQR